MKHKQKTLALPMMALVVMSAMFVAFVPDSSDAAGFDDYGTASNINTAPGYSWTYTPSYPSDISNHVITTIQIQGISFGNSGTWASISSSGLVSVTIPTTAAVGTVYHLVLKASMTEPVPQTAYQHITFTITSGLSISGSIDNIIKGTAVNFTPSGTSSMGDVVWSVTLIGLSMYQLGWKDSIAELRSLLGLCGIDVIAVAGVGWSVEDIAESVNASVNVMLFRNIGDLIAEWYDDNRSIPCVESPCGVPLGFDQTELWIKTVCDALKCDSTPALKRIGEARVRTADNIWGHLLPG